MTLGLPRRADLDPRGLLRRLDPALAEAPLRELGEGFDNVAWAVDERRCLRVSKKHDPADRRRDAEHDVRLLDLVATHVSLPTSRVLATDADEGALLLTLVAGPTADVVPPRDPARFAATTARLLDELSAVPLEEAARVVGPDRDVAAWLEETRAAWREAAPLLPPAEVDAVEELLAGPLPDERGPRVFSHNDLGDEHLVMTPDGRDLAGVIDWSDAVLGDPARDLALLAFDLGPDVLDLVLERRRTVGDPDLRRRALWFAARAGAEGVAYRALHRRPSLPVARAALRRVLSAAG